ncbi:MAG TPA: type II toxin-antitoxin system HicA family toxin [Candidatus Aminicenantes bacterium]|nr:type II toxin-antitoxin system HicA family toxin [Candidatus Aminicenantes bacterium]
MPGKIRELIRDLERAGFFVHESGAVITFSGNPGEDAKPYQEKAVRQKIEEASNESQR